MVEQMFVFNVCACERCSFFSVSSSMNGHCVILCFVVNRSSERTFFRYEQHLICRSMVRVLSRY